MFLWIPPDLKRNVSFTRQINLRKWKQNKYMYGISFNLFVLYLHEEYIAFFSSDEERASPVFKREVLILLENHELYPDTQFPPNFSMYRIWTELEWISNWICSDLCLYESTAFFATISSYYLASLPLTTYNHCSLWQWLIYFTSIWKSDDSI